MHAHMPDNTALQDERAIIAAALKDPAAFAPLYEQHAPAIYRFCYLRLGHRETADDLTAKVFVRALERLHQYRPQSGATFRSWLFAIARHMLADEWRRRKDIRLIPPIEDLTQEDYPGPEQLAVHRTEMDRLRTALQSLPDRQREIVELRLVGFTSDEIAAAMHTTIPAVKSAQARAYLTLRRLIGEGGKQ